jgi:aminoglycoside 6'-N-acetyltransferase I
VKVELKLMSPDDAQVIKNLWPLYLHDLSEFDGSVLNSHGVLSEDESVCSVGQHAEGIHDWWQDSEGLFPYLILVDGRPAGFNLVASPPYLPQEIEAEFVVHELFVVHAHRGARVAEQAVIQGFDRHRGRWEVVTYPNHGRAVAFWRRVLGGYAPHGVRESEGEHVWGRKVIFKFDNAP